MKQKLIILGAILFLGYCFYSCKKDKYATVSPQNMYYNYFPLKKGDSVIYRVDSFIFNNNTNTYDTSPYFVLQYIKDTFTDNTGHLAYKLDRFWKIQPTDSWTQGNVWQEQIINNSAQTFEENIRYIRLEFPVANGTAWNGNEFNNIDTLGVYNYNYVNAFKPWAGAYKKSYDSSVTVMQVNTTDPFNSLTYNFLYRIYGYEVYAANVGLVYKYFKYANYSNYQTDSVNGKTDTTDIISFGVSQTLYYCSYHK